MCNKKRKMEVNMEAQSNHFSSKMRPWAKQGRLIHSLCLIFEGSKNHSFFDADLEGQKINQNQALEPQGPKVVLRLFTKWGGSGLDGLRAAANYQRNTRKKGSRIAKETLTRRGPLAQRISKLICIFLLMLLVLINIERLMTRLN